MKKKFIRHFRIYFKNNHPAYIVDEEGNGYVFHRVTHSKTSGGKKNWKKENPLKDGSRFMFIAKQEQRDDKRYFSPFILDTSKYVDISYPEIKLTKTLKRLNRCGKKATIKKKRKHKKTGNLQTNKK